MNKKLLTLLTLTFLFSMSTYAFAFTDTTGHWAEKTIANAKKNNVINGYSDNTFKPDAPMTRAELVAVINRLLVIESESDKYVPDVKRQDWFHTDIRKAMTMGIIQGDENGFVNPNAFVTREQATLIMARAFGIMSNEQVVPTSFKDENEISEWARNELLSFIKKQYITGYPDNTLRAKSNITRAEILSIINRIIGENPNQITADSKINGNILINEKNVSLRNIEIYGDVIVGEGIIDSFSMINCIVNGNLVLYAPIDFEKNIVKVEGEIVKIYDNKISSNLHYNNDIYGINFPLPDGTKTKNKGEVNNSDFTYNDFIIIDIKQDTKYYFENIGMISKTEIASQKYDSIFKKIESGYLESYPYELYKDNAKSRLLIIKRDNIVYTLLFANIVSENILDNVMSNIKFTSGEKVIMHDDVVYKNSKLCLKFTYKNGYVGVDDSYNTDVVYTGDAFFKLFIQVNMITDIDEYSIEQVSVLLKNLIKNDGNIVDEKIGKIYNHDTIQFEIVSEEDKIISMYVIVGNNLYNFIYKGEIDKMDAIGKDIFKEIINSMEF